MSSGRPIRVRLASATFSSIHRGSAGVDRPVQCDPHDRVELRGGLVDHRLLRPTDHDVDRGGVVDQRVHRAEGPHRLSDQRHHIGLVAEVRTDEHGLPALGADPLDDASAEVLRTTRDDHLGPLGGEPAGDLRADPLR
jgi:hypothetical protein